MTLPQRNLSGAWLAKGTGVEEAEIKGAHLRLPGWSNQGPTLEIFQYTNNKEQQFPLANRKGLGHLAFEVADVDAALEKALAFGGQRYGEVVSHAVEAIGTLTFVYLRDPDGNIIELQHWDKAEALPLQEQTVQAKHTTDDRPQPLKKTPPNTPTERELPSPKPIAPPTAPSAYVQGDDEPNIDPYTDKRAYLNALHNDVDQTNQSVRDAKAEIRASKEALRQQQNALRKDGQYTNEDRTIKKSKQELLQDLKGEMEQEDLDQRALPTPAQPQPTKQPTPLPSTVEMPNVTIQLQIELKTGNAVDGLSVTEEHLSIATHELAHNLHLLTTVTHPQGAGLSFLEYLGKQYRADLVPLVKALKTEQSKTEQNNAWILLPRLKGSIHHLLQQCEQQRPVLEQLGLEQLELSPLTFVATYENLMKIADLAEQKGATYLRLSYTKQAAN
jgi:catechol 2,3-dioxygenase-like lactoylglutathione lyase family enzyme